MNRVSLRGAGVAVLLCLVLACTTSEKYAVLVSAEETVPSSGQSVNNIQFWSDLVLTYRLLLENGYDPDNIFVLYGTGHDYAAGQPPCTANWCRGHKIVDLPLARHVSTLAPCPADDPFCSSEITCKKNQTTGSWDNCSVYQLLDCLAKGCNANSIWRRFDCNHAVQSCSTEHIPKLKKEDFLFVWWKGHGSSDAPLTPQLSDQTDCNSSLKLGSDPLPVGELGEWIDTLPCDRRVLAIEACGIGGATKVLQNLRPIAPITVVSCGCQQDSEQNLVHGIWTEAFDSAMFPPLHRRALLARSPWPPSDRNTDGRVSCAEAFEWSYGETITKSDALQQPQIGDPGNAAIRVDLTNPYTDIPQSQPLP